MEITETHQGHGGSAATSTGIQGGTVTRRAVVGVDLDNLLNDSGRGYGRLDIRGFCARIRAEVGDDCAINVFANRMADSIVRIWELNGAEVTRVGQNVDPVMARWLAGFVDVQCAVIVSGDHYFVSIAHLHRSMGHRVDVWSRREAASRELVFAADRVNFEIEGLLYQPAQGRA